MKSGFVMKNRRVSGWGTVVKTGFCGLGFAALPIAVTTVTLVPGRAAAQVVISVGAQELYDDNIYLENDNGTPPPFIVDESLTDPDVVIDPPIQANGDPDDDLITNVYIAMSGAIPISPHLKSSAEGRVGALIFSDNSDESRMTLDGTFTIETEKDVLPEPFKLATNHVIRSAANDITAADGTATRQTQTYDGNIVLSASPYKVASATELGISYTFNYHAFLGDFTFNEKSEEDLGPFDSRVEDRGSDYITNSLDSNLDQTLTENLVAGLYAGVTDYVFTSVETNDPLGEQKTTDDLDRTEGRTGIRSTYRVTKELTLTGSSGVSLSHLQKKPDDETVTVIADDGTQTTQTFDGQQDDVSFTFGAEVSYAPEPVTLLRAAIDQGQRTDIDGDRIITRTVTLDANRGFGDRLNLRLGGRFLQYNIGDNISNPTERFEATTSLQYNITQAIALEIGYNYVNQDADEQNFEQRFFFGSEDYEASRAFIGITTGIVGSKG